MKKLLLLFIFILGCFFFSCESDDFCTEDAATPKLVIRFYNKDTIIKTKAVERLSVIASSKTDSLFTNATTDSIAIPLNPLDNKTIYTFKINTIDGATANNQTATFTINYNTDQIYVSRSCGFKAIFNNVTINQTSSWVDDLSTSSIPLIINQNQAHVKVYH